MSRIENGLSNHCFLMRASLAREFRGDADRIVREIIFQNPRAAETLRHAEIASNWLAVSVDDFGLKDLNPAPNLFSIGDAGAFIDPFTGSGMLMALESGEILAEAITESGSAELVARRYKLLHARKFQKRLFVCSFLRRAAFIPHAAKFLISALNTVPIPLKILARATRP